jgi:hypothetical protein
VRELLRKYLAERIAFYESSFGPQLQQITSTTVQMQAELWAAVRSAAWANPTPVTALAVSGMNDVLNSQGYTESAYLNRIPIGAWALMAVIAISATMMVGYGSRHAEKQTILLFVLPLILSVSFMLISDIDSPRGGLIRVKPQNLESLTQSFH